jgi:thromboxane-A synthase/cytochrome P450 family 3 subfamily A
MTSRKVVKDLELQPGVVVRKGLPIFTCLYAYQRDPEYWPRALEFLPERFLPEGAAALGPTTENAWTPFGAGPRMCIGWRFALNEAKIALLRLHQRLEYELAPGQVPLKLRLGITLSPAEGVIVTPKLRAAPAAPAAA